MPFGHNILLLFRRLDIRRAEKIYFEKKYTINLNVYHITYVKDLISGEKSNNNNNESELCFLSRNKYYCFG